MDSSDVSRAIRAVIRPLLRQHGFVQFSERTAWRYGAGVIHVVNFQSMGRRYAADAEATAHSFAVNLGVHYPPVPQATGLRAISVRNGRLLPQEAQCHIRIRLCKTLEQSESFETDIWHVDRDGQSLPQVTEHVALGMEQQAFPWFVGWSDRREAIQRLQRSDGLDDGAWASGLSHSPERSRVIAYLAWSIGDLGMAETYLKEALARYRSALAEAHPWMAGYWQRIVDRLTDDRERLVTGAPPAP
jgi:hypothetical protein